MANLNQEILKELFELRKELYFVNNVVCDFNPELKGQLEELHVKLNDIYSEYHGVIHEINAGRDREGIFSSIMYKDIYDKYSNFENEHKELKEQLVNELCDKLCDSSIIKSKLDSQIQLTSDAMNKSYRKDYESIIRELKSIKAKMEHQRESIKDEIRIKMNELIDSGDVGRVSETISDIDDKYSAYFNYYHDKSESLCDRSVFEDTEISKFSSYEQDVMWDKIENATYPEEIDLELFKEDLAEQLSRVESYLESNNSAERIEVVQSKLGEEKLRYLYESVTSLENLKGKLDIYNNPSEVRFYVQNNLGADRAELENFKKIMNHVIKEDNFPTELMKKQEVEDRRDYIQMQPMNVEVYYNYGQLTERPIQNAKNDADSIGRNQDMTSTQGPHSK